METLICCASVAVVALLTCQCLQLRLRAGQSHQLYQDNDGVATRDSEVESLRITQEKLVMNTAAAVGISASALNAYEFVSMSQWSVPIAALISCTLFWSLVGIQVLIIANETSICERYTQGLCTAGSATVLALLITYRDIVINHNLEIVSTERICTVSIIIACLTLPRRPVVHVDGRRVDHQNGASVISLLSFSWYPLYQPAFSVATNLNLHDLVLLPLSQRIRTLQQRFSQCASHGRLLYKLTLAWRRPLSFQWALTLLHGLSQFAGQYFVQRLLSCMEQPSSPNHYGMGASVSQAYVSSQHCLKAVLKMLLDVSYLIHLIGLKHIAIGCLFPIILFPISRILAHRHRIAKLELSNSHHAFSVEVSELLRSLRQIRLSSMEKLWEDRVIESRAQELRKIWSCGVLLAALTLITNLGPILLISVSLSAYALEAGRLSPSLAFASIGLFRNLHTAIQDLPAMIANLQESIVASRRIERYLQLPGELQTSGKAKLLTFKEAKISWPNGSIDSESSESFSLRNVNLHFPKAKMTVVTGKTSSGKGLLLAALLGEAVVQSDDGRPGPAPAEESPHTTYGIAYVSQPPWIENRTIKQNIIFGNQFDEDRYAGVLYACALNRDLDALPDGDLTMAGVNGGALSGGQKWRVSLARALYSSSMTILLDDVLSAVDPHVAKWLCAHALSGRLVRGRTVIIATHHLTVCEHLASYIVTVENGTTSARSVVPTHNKQRLKVESMPRSATSSPKPDLVVDAKGGGRKHAASSKRSTIQTFIFYLLGSGIVSVGLAVLTTFACRLLTAGNSWWLTKWTFNKQLDNQALRVNLYIYLALSVAGAVAVAIHSLAVHGVSQRASEALFQKTVHGVLRSPLRWIDSTSLGKLLQSLTTDMYLIEHRVASGLSDLLRIIMQLLLVVCTSGIVTPQTIAMMMIMLVFYYKITTRHLQMSKRLNRLIPLAAQPILEHVNSTEAGILTIRAFNKEATYINRMEDLLDMEMRLSWHIILGQRWIHGRYGILGSLFVCATAVSLVLGHANAATAGFAINVALQIKATMSGMMGKINLLTSGSRAIDRVLEIAGAPTESQEGNDVVTTWSATGRVRVENITVRYGNDFPAVLQGITFSLAAGERLGVVGRTGAGKTSLVNALLRFIEVGAGAIYIDDTDIASIKIAHLRRSISVIPQDPFLFSDTLRANLNIHGRRSDEELQAALAKVAIRAKDDSIATAAETLRDLDLVIQPGGENLSHGQRQMVCLARAILDPRRIVILDEATSAVDRATDTMVQDVIRREFAKSTIIVVAHRLATVADFDKILVLDQGAGVEFGSPAELMEKKGAFWDMVNQSGDAQIVRKAIGSRG
ncbi:hypothetical protein NLG97_g9045 [Lecanicillium saksenae]|uniref:Uncharacterized protein n=1 Tax=Lecanicillium saksenae TaxID=468837 RepID=A0ACC1QIZ9_9HYPO|nr:hypothetical protein NLG97_g9045 [Lecanicillium saksenae]